MKKNLPYKRIIFVCINKRPEGEDCCSSAGQQIREDLKAYAKERNLKGIVRVSASQCMDKCEIGPNIMIFPENIWYHNATSEDIEEIKREYIDPLVKR